MIEQAQSILQKTFGYDAFLRGQEEVIGHLLQNEDTVGIMPTGGGKSLCYQIPALLFSGVTLVISPLISLMKDQVDTLAEEGIPATFINSSLHAGEVRSRLQQGVQNHYKIIYIAPERLENASFIDWLSQLPVSLVAIDEAHCISQWGHDFRPSYRKIEQMIRELPTDPRVVALTATATPRVSRDICDSLHISRDHVVSTGFRRDNLIFRVIKGQDRDAYLTAYIRKNNNQSGIIYASTRKEVERLHQKLQSEDMNAGKYHAGMSKEDRRSMQEQFLYDDITVMVATNAFGMGIDKSNVHFVIHYNMPKNIESYYQEAGRAGRDGETSECILLFTPQDIRLPKFFIDESEMDDEHKQYEYEKLQQMIGYCHAESCLQQYILAYFGEKDTEPCGQCGNCTDNRTANDVTQEAQMVFSCIKRMRQRFGKMMITKVLVGSKDKRIRDLAFDQISTFGIMKSHTQKQVMQLIDFFTAERFLHPTNGQYSVLILTEKAIEVLHGKEQVWKKEHAQARQFTIDDALFTRLRNLRKRLADDDNVPPYVIFSDATLRSMCEQRPTTSEAMLQVKGVGQRKLASFGHLFMKEMADYDAENHSKIE